MNKEQALHQFWSGFGLKAYDEYTVPDNAMEANNGHYLTYNVSTAGLDEPVFSSASLWYKSTSWAEITLMAETIYAYIGSGGMVVPYDNGALWVKRGTPFAQRMADEDDTIRRIYINVAIEFFT